ncbi:4-alpha-glucanotransferase [Trichlorobacter ammonificans]|uniref:4-alpha-glucanotransferase n=1 Tax=Trichlorobacter ammonificans TaxID=2916410 RepID=A0ABN8HJ15_9BACT|nr:4-alpha-glucanotransferase [Trichlorobacter ammonificans]CAH2030993.1 4-alpha-glucanotransferase [Trichlorobacter ammonificans]
MTRQRRAGVLLHPTSLPGSNGIGTLGVELRGFLEFLAAGGFSLWQVLPLTPPAAGNSPYSAYSAFAGNHLLIDLEQLVREGDLAAERLQGADFPAERVDFERVVPWKEALLQEAAERFFARNDSERLAEFWQFCDSTYWLHDYALFRALKVQYKGRPWTRWPTDLARRVPEALECASRKLGPAIGAEKYRQWQFFRQWRQVREWAEELKIGIVGDLPIFVAHDSADVWCNREQFLLDERGKPLAVAGVPPDYFSATGQLWGNPLYNWPVMEQRGFDWWVARIRQMTDLFDLVRIDHFRGFAAAWQVGARERTAKNGSWVAGPGFSFFEAVRAAIGNLPFIAEDLGVITPDVEALRDGFGLPGMKILQFAFDSDAANPYLPHNHHPATVVYTGTHDNDTSQGWLDSLDSRIERRIRDYLGKEHPIVIDDLIRMTLMSVADIAVIPFQDLFGLSTGARMNRPGTAFGNWEWRFSADLPLRERVPLVREYLERYGRLNTA